MNIWGIHRKYPALTWFENFMGGHVSFIGITIYGANAMNWAVNIKTGFGYFCFSLPVLSRLKKNCQGKLFYDWYIYLSPDGTPDASTFYRGIDKKQVIVSQIRRFNLGHGYKMSEEEGRVRAINNRFYSLWVWDFSKDIR